MWMLVLGNFAVVLYGFVRIFRFCGQMAVHVLIFQRFTCPSKTIFGGIVENREFFEIGICKVMFLQNIVLVGYSFIYINLLKTYENQTD